MLQYLIKTTENSLSAAILIALLFVFVHERNIDSHRKWPVIGALIGAVAALVLSWIIHATVLINREFLNIGILSVSIIVSIVFVASSWGAFRGKFPGFAIVAPDLTASALSAALLIYCLPTVALYPTQFLMAGESIFSTDFLFKSIGYSGGILIVSLAALALFRMRGNVPAALLRVVLTASLAVNVADQFSSVVQFLLARRIIPMSSGLFEFVKISVNYGDYFLFLIMALALPAPLFLWIANLRPQGHCENPAQYRKARSIARSVRRYSALFLVCCALSAVCLTVARSYDEREVILSPAEPMTIDGDRILIPVDDIGDGHLHRFAYTSSEGTEVRFIVIKKNESAWGVGLDACDICGATGYYERKDEVICKLCDVVMNKSTIGFKGGCNPVPLAYSVSEGNMVVSIRDLEDEQKRFQ